MYTGCNPTCRRLQPYVPQAATLRAAGCNPTCRRLQPYVPVCRTQALLTLLPTSDEEALVRGWLAEAG